MHEEDRESRGKMRFMPSHCAHCGAPLTQAMHAAGACAFCRVPIPRAEQPAPPQVVVVYRDAPAPKKKGSGCAIFFGLLLVLGIAGVLVYFLVLHHDEEEETRKEAAVEEATATFVLSGSSTLAQSIVPEMVLEYVKSRGAADAKLVEKHKKKIWIVTGTAGSEKIKVVIEATSTGDGFRCLTSGTCQIALASRAVQAEENARIPGIDEQVVG